jgi:diguanylate cyclase (GGDEF)-like protein/PAS domain S-box-containing protein
VRELFPQQVNGSDALWPLPVAKPARRGFHSLLEAPLTGVLFGALCALGRVFVHEMHHIAAFWPADGVLLAWLLRRPLRVWPRILLFAWIADAASTLWMGGSLSMSLILAGCNMVEVMLPAMVLWRWLPADRDLTSPRFMLLFAGTAGLAAPALSGFLAAVYYSLAFGAPVSLVFRHWFPPYAFGMMLMTPFMLALMDPALRMLFSRGSIVRTLGAFISMLAFCIIIFGQNRYAVFFGLVPLLMIAMYQVRVVGTAILCFEFSAVAALFTLHQHGPFWLMGQGDMAKAVLLLQCSGFLMVLWIFPLAATLDRQRKLRASYALEMRRYRLLADNSRDIVVVATLEGRRIYVSPAVEDILGWRQEEWLNRDATDTMHPDDVPAFQRMLKSMTQGTDRGIFRYRTRHRRGHYVSMEATLRVLPDEQTGEPDGFVAIVRDISERVEAAQKLEEAHRMLQQQAQRDGLTQLFNRRYFDEALEREWRRGRRTRYPVALLMVDLDHFKQINDSYGHRAGDQCLRHLAPLLKEVAKRPSDVIARYGGEEFALLLPDVSLDAAMMLAELLCIKVRETEFDIGIGRPLPLRVSIGVAAEIPDKNNRADHLVEMADRALYTAKQLGRDRVAHGEQVISSAQLLAHVR